jgi:hypothetical protein
MTRPDDECPYPRPFPADFNSCPAYQPRQFIPLDTLYQPLDPVLTCRHLETRAMTQRHPAQAVPGAGPKLLPAAGAKTARGDDLASALARFGLAREALQ